MSFTSLINKQSILFSITGILFTFTSCGSFQYAGTYEDGIYSDSAPVDQNYNNIDNSSSASNYYKNYFEGKAISLDDENAVIMDSGSYQGSYQAQDTDAENYAGWGQNNSSDITINFNNNNPNYGYGWGAPYGNSWNRGSILL